MDKGHCPLEQVQGVQVNVGQWEVGKVYLSPTPAISIMTGPQSKALKPDTATCLVGKQSDCVKFPFPVKTKIESKTYVNTKGVV